MKLEGEFRNGILHGLGAKTSTDGTRIEGEFKNGKL